MRAKGDIKARDMALEALKICDQKLPEEYVLKGKIYFNLAAAKSDIEPYDLEEAEKNLNTAFEFYQRSQSTVDMVRTKIRIAQVKNQQCDYAGAMIVLNGINIDNIQSPRVKMQYFYQMGKTHDYLEQFDSAIDFVKKSEKIALDLDALVDKKELKLYLSKLKKTR